MTDRSGNAVPERWWEAFFDDDYADAFLTPHDETEIARVDAIADFLVEHLALEPGARVLDQCCGIGRLSVPLAARGVHVTGVELIERYVYRARAAAAGAACTFHCADARVFTPPEPCDAAFNWFTSFGYDPDDRVNARLLGRAFASLRPGGRFALEMVNVARVLSDFRPHDVVRRPGPDGETRIVVDNELDLARGMVTSTWEFIRPDGRRDARRAETRLLMPHELAHLIRSAGFEDVCIVAWPDAGPLLATSPRCIALARRGRN